MTTTTYEGGPSRPELEMLLRAAARAATPVEHGREQGRRVTRSMLTGLALLAGTVALYDLTLLVGGV